MTKAQAAFDKYIELIIEELIEGDEEWKEAGGMPPNEWEYNVYHHTMDLLTKAGVNYRPKRNK